MTLSMKIIINKLTCMKVFVIFCLVEFIVCQNCYLRLTRKLNYEIVRAHNIYRLYHHAQSLAIDDDLIESSIKWSKYLLELGKLQFSNQSDYGENLWMTTGKKNFQYIIEMPSKVWYRQNENYNYGEGRYSSDAAYFTQMVWKDTEKMGCGVCTKNRITILTCRYRPEGNVFGKFEGNVEMLNQSVPDLSDYHKVDEGTSMLILAFVIGTLIMFSLVLFVFSLLLTLK